MYNNFGIIGNPLSHTLSPVIHNYFIQLTKLNAGYTAYEITSADDIKEMINFFKKYKFLGINITVPYKELVIKFADELDLSVQVMGACNTLKFTDNKTLAYNTDLFGIKELFTLNNILLTSKKLLLIGAGGVARAVVSALNSYENIELYIVNRDQKKAENIALISKHDVTVLKYDDIKNFRSDIAINSTSIGLSDKCFPDYNLQVNDAVIDLQYGKIMTPFLTLFNKEKIKKVDGLDMLIFQAYQSFNIWTGLFPKIDVDELRDRILTSI